MPSFQFCFLHLIVIILLASPASYGDELPHQTISASYAVTGASAIVTSQMSHASLSYQHELETLDIFHTDAPYQWYLDGALTFSFFRLKDPLPRLGITNTPQATSDIDGTNYNIEVGLLRRQHIYKALDGILGARLGLFGIQTTGLTGTTATAQPYSIDSKTGLGLTVSSHMGVELNVYADYSVSFFLQLRRYYMGEFTIRDRVSGVEAKYPGFTTVGFGLGFVRAF